MAIRGRLHRDLPCDVKTGESSRNTVLGRPHARFLLFSKMLLKHDYEWPIDHLANREKADAPAGVYLLDGTWHLAAHDSPAEERLLDRGALLVATLTFTPPARPLHVSEISARAILQHYSASAC